MSELRKAIIAALNEYTERADCCARLEDIVERHVAAMMVPAEFDVRRVAIAATGDVGEGGWVPIFAQSVEQVNDALSAAAERTNRMRERGDMYAEASRKKAGWLLEERRKVADANVINARLVAILDEVRDRAERGKAVVEMIEEELASLAHRPPGMVRGESIFAGMANLGPVSQVAESAEVKAVGVAGAELGKAMAKNCDAVAIGIMRKAGVVDPVMGEVMP